MRHLYISLLAAFSLVIIVSVSGCGGEPPKPSAENVKARSALGKLEEMRKAYVALDMQGMMDNVSSGFEGGYSELSTSVRKDMDNYKRIEMKIFIERVELEAGAVKVVFHWQGKWWDKDDAMIEGRGNSVFSFADDEKMQLIKITGDYPFGIIR